jgi:ferrochelatase
LAERTERQRDALQAELDRRAEGRFEIALGYKHAAPHIEAAVETLAAGGIERLVGLTLAPQYSALSVGEYLARAAGSAATVGLAFSGIESWATEPALVEFLGAEIRSRLAGMPPNTKVLFTAHSLPARILSNGDPYPAEVRSTAAAVSAAIGLAEWAQWSVAWQSAGRTPEPWIGPDILTVIDELAGSENADGLLVCPCGFVSDHLEVLYDLDVEARQRAEERALVFARTASVNDDRTVFAALAERILLE